MKISEVIKGLELAKNEMGDIEVVGVRQDEPNMPTAIANISLWRINKGYVLIQLKNNGIKFNEKETA